MASNLHHPAYKTFLKKLIGLRRSRGISQKTVAQYFGKEQSVISKSERGERRIDAVEIVLYARAIGVQPADIIQLADDAVGDHQ